MFSLMQRDFWRNCNHRWNIKTGATRSGKTYQDYFLISKRLLAVADKEGLNVILGNTRETIRRNILLPMQNLYGAEYVSNLRADNSCEMFGQKVFCLGADNANRVDKVRGSSIKYCYGDEITTWNPDVFDMLKSRLDKSYSIFDGTCNPANPQHWFKQFLDSDADIYQQAYTIDDNPFLDPAFVANLKKEYSGTVLYDRYILGLWVAAEGVIYRQFCDDPERFIIDDLEQGDAASVWRERMAESGAVCVTYHAWARCAIYTGRGACRVVLGGVGEYGELFHHGHGNVASTYVKNICSLCLL